MLAGLRSLFEGPPGPTPTPPATEELSSTFDGGFVIHGKPRKPKKILLPYQDQPLTEPLYWESGERESDDEDEFWAILGTEL